MNYQQVVNWLAKDILASTEAQADIESNVDKYLEDLSKDVQEKAEALGKEQFRLMKRNISRLAKKHFKGRCIDVFFEHNHWWLRFDDEVGQHTFAVVDAEPGLLHSGLNFEETDFVEN